MQCGIRRIPHTQAMQFTVKDRFCPFYCHDKWCICSTYRITESWRNTANVSTHKHMWCRALMALILSHSFWGFGRAERERRVHYVQQLYPFHLYCNTLHAAQRDNSLNSPFSGTQSDTFQQYPVVSLKGELGIPLQSMYQHQHLSWLVQCGYIPRMAV